MSTVLNPPTPRYYPDERWGPEIPRDIKEGSRLTWDALYSLKDRQMDVREFVLTSPRGMNIATTIGKPLLVVLIQDGIGGWVVSWPLKFQDSAGLNLDLTANTYTTILWYPISNERVIAVGGMTGGVLS